MTRYERFTFLCNEDERQMIEVLAGRFQRSQSDTLRFLIRLAISEFDNQSKPSRRANAIDGVDDN